MPEIIYKETKLPTIEEISELYKSVGWGHSDCPKATFDAVKNSSFLVTAWNKEKLIGLGRAISDGVITVYFPDLLVNPDFQGQGIGTEIMKRLLSKYGHFHNQVLIAEDEKARTFYKKIGFKDEKFTLSICKPFPNEKK